MDLAGPVLETLRWAFPNRLDVIARPDGDGVTIRVSGPLERVWHLVVRAGRWRFGPDPAGRVVAVMDLTTEQAWRLLTNNLGGAARVDLRTSGDQNIVEALRETRAIIGVPK